MTDVASPTDTTPIMRVGDIFVKRDDFFSIGDCRGGKVRTCLHLARGAKGLTTAGSRSSPQVNIVAHVAKMLGVPCRVHVPEGALSPEVEMARDLGAEIIQHRPGYNTVIVARSREDAKSRGWVDVPFGMECEDAVRLTAMQVADFPSEVERVVVPVGSGMTLAGVLHGIVASGRRVPVLGVVVGASPEKRLDKYAPKGWRDLVTLTPSGLDYHDTVDACIGEIPLDAVYEAKCLKFLRSGDLFWIVGRRATHGVRWRGR